MCKMPQSLNQLGLTARSRQSVKITGISANSRAIKEGFLFAALPGNQTHGAQYISQALQNGASAILTDKTGIDIARHDLSYSNAAVIVSENPQQVLAHTAAIWFGKQPRTIVAVTGTNGKTSVVNFVRQIWMELGYAAINVGTTGVEGWLSESLALTTPDPMTLHQVLAKATSQEVTHVAMEASSHGLAQYRLDGVQIQAAAFSNLSHDHLDYHQTIEEYFDTKLDLFRRVLIPAGIAVVNLNDPKGTKVCSVVKTSGRKVMTVGRLQGDLSLMGQRFDECGQEVAFTYQGKTHSIRLDLIGGFQAENVLLACGLVIATGENPDQVFDVLPKLTTVRGRMQLAAVRDNKASIYVDFAHTPDALIAALKSLRLHIMGKLIAIIGAGGDRDRSKRSLMGRAASAHADTVFVTDDNPRHEEPSQIRADVIAGTKDAIEVSDRAEAILRGVDMLNPGDALLIAGKGHETVQIVGNVTYPFDDVEHASIAAAVLDGRYV
ncbi:MAG: UDP-N-acetylmuramoyl-L-alanyl-D-glutamate--2,6-diaminopimelate ligase [Aestuariivita sp.]|nr:UDP-N-acetylmuramoyl-L-alanyl-D-glutamate--2,6-diaminopimelate ligase [Aestuariivita sp.]